MIVSAPMTWAAGWLAFKLRVVWVGLSQRGHDAHSGKHLYAMR